MGICSKEGHWAQQGSSSLALWLEAVLATEGEAREVEAPVAYAI